MSGETQQGASFNLACWVSQAQPNLQKIRLDPTTLNS